LYGQIKEEFNDSYELKNLDFSQIFFENNNINEDDFINEFINYEEEHWETSRILIRRILDLI